MLPLYLLRSACNPLSGATNVLRWPLNAFEPFTLSPSRSLSVMFVAVSTLSGLQFIVIALFALLCPNHK